ncbi:hypothetical protein PCLA_03f0448 [Pseudomonas citronellolis]|nr:hypothetical protein PCLA_03f0448 [Pseudomonas citronellolis]
MREKNRRTHPGCDRGWGGGGCRSAAGRLASLIRLSVCAGVGLGGRFRWGGKKRCRGGGALRRSELAREWASLRGLFASKLAPTRGRAWLCRGGNGLLGSRVRGNDGVRMVFSDVIPANAGTQRTTERTLSAMEFVGGCGVGFKSALSLTLSLKGEGTVRCALVFRR